MNKMIRMFRPVGRWAAVVYELRSCWYRIRSRWSVVLVFDEVKKSLPSIPSHDLAGNEIIAPSFIDALDALEKERPWLSLGDCELFLQGWFQAELATRKRDAIKGALTAALSRVSQDRTVASMHEVLNREFPAPLVGGKK